MTVGGFLDACALGLCAKAMDGATSEAMRPARTMPRGADFTRSSPKSSRPTSLSYVATTCFIVKSVHREADPAAQRDHADPYRKRDGGSGLGGQRRGSSSRVPTRDVTNAEQVKGRHVETGQREQHELALEQAI